MDKVKVFADKQTNRQTDGQTKHACPQISNSVMGPRDQQKSIADKHLFIYNYIPKNMT